MMKLQLISSPDWNRKQMTSSNPTQNNNQNQKKSSDKKIVRCKYCYRCGHTDEDCQDKKQKRPPSMPSWVSKTTCMNCKKKGHLAFNCPPKYACKVIRPKNQKSKKTTRTMANNVKDEPEQTCKIVEFAGMATSKLINPKIKSRHRQGENNPTSCYGTSRHTKCSLSNSEWDHKSSYQYHKNKLKNISTYDISNHHKEYFYHLLLKRTRNNNLYTLY